jgi:hypothetical protein
MTRLPSSKTGARYEWKEKKVQNFFFISSFGFGSERHQLAFLIFPLTRPAAAF